MKSYTKRIILALTVMLGFAAGLNAQQRSAHYEVTAPQGVAGGYAAELEQRFAAFNKVFQFDPAALSSLLRVRVFTDKGEYDSYVSSKLGSSKPGAVYIHYRNPANRELVIHRGSEEEKTLVPHQAFIQFLRAFISEPPVWLREGFAVYFNNLVYDAAKGKLDYEENLTWLETVKRLAVNPEAVFLAEATFPHIQASSWSLVSFFMSDKSSDYYRALTDSIMILSPDAAAEENAQKMYNRLVLFNPIADLTRDYRAYIAGKRTFLELVEDGQRAYGGKNYLLAGDLFRKAAELKSSHYAPYYYLGLIAYEDKKYTDAEGFYKTALDYGAERAMVQYARGVNAAAAGKKADAIAFLQEASTADSAQYKARSDEIINKLR